MKGCLIGLFYRAIPRVRCSSLAQADWDLVRAEERHPLADATPRDGVRLGDDLLASSS